MGEPSASSRVGLAAGCVLAPAVVALVAAALQAPAWLVAGLALLTTLPAARLLHARCLKPLLDRLAERQHQLERVQVASLAAQAGRTLLVAILDRVDEPILATDERGCVIYASPAAAQRLSPAVESAEPPPLDHIFTEPELLTFERACRSRPEEPQRSLRLKLPTPGGSDAQWRVLGCPLTLEPADPPGALLLFRDETALAAALRARADFVANASHELRTPLAAIQGAVATLRSVIRDDPQSTARFIDMIDANAERLADIARRLLDLSRLESGAVPVRCEPFDPSKLKRSLEALFAPMCDHKRVTLRVEIDEALAGFPVDPWRLWLILLNLVDNAIKFSHNDSEVRLRASRAGERARFTVEDHGAGIPLADQQRVFERFYQADEARAGSDRKGAGLGLAVVKHAVRELKGDIELESVYGEGTTVRVDLPPAAPDEQAPPTRTDRPAQSSSGSLRTIS